MSQDGLPVLDGGRVLDVQNVIWCTGFRPDFSWIDVPFEIGEDGYPVQYRGVVESVSGPLLRGAALPALVHVDAHRRDGPGCRAGREAHRGSAGASQKCSAASVAAIAEQIAS